MDDLPLAAKELWMAARRLGDEADKEWTFPLFVSRTFALTLELGPKRPTGLDFMYEPLNTWNELATTLNVREQLHQGGVSSAYLPQVQLGFEIFESAFRTSSGTLPLPDPDDTFRGRHVVFVLGLVSETALAFQNSWGADWGDGGRGYISEEYFDRHIREVWVSRPSWIGWSPAMEHALEERALTQGDPGLPTLADVVATWMTPNPRFRTTQDVAGREIIVRTRRVLASHADSAPLNLVDIADETGLLGRAHALLPRDTDEVVVEELFVSPVARERGLGSSLLRIVEERASAEGKTSMTVLLHEADASEVGLPRALAFGRARGFDWEFSASSRPCVVALARKELRA
jgi:GNAT superfamily N-acetyltransferase